MRWALIDCDGVLHKGEGPVSGINKLIHGAKVLCVQFPSSPPVYVAGPAIVKWRVEGSIGSSVTRRWWGLDSELTGRTWFWPDGSMIGIGRSVEEVEEARDLLLRSS